MTTTVEQWADNATGTFGAPATTGATTISVAQLSGVFPSLTGDEVFHIVIDFNTVNAEIVEVTAISGSVGAGWIMTLAAPGLVNDHNGPPAGASVAQVITKEGLDSMVAESVLLATFTTAGDMIYGTGPAAVARLGIGADGYVLKVVSGVPAWAVNAAPPIGAAGGDLAGTYPDPTIGSIQGVAISGTPAAGNGLYATSASAAAWGSLTSAQVAKIFAAAGDLLHGTGAGTGAILSIGSATDVLVVSGSEPAWTTPAAVVESGFTVAGDIFVGTGSGTGKILPIGGSSGEALIVGGADPSGLEWGSPSLPFNSGVLSAPVTAVANSSTTVLTTASLAIGTWLLTVNALVAYDTAATAPVVFYLVDNTATSTFSGPQRAQGPYPDTTTTPVPVSFTTLVTVTVAGTVYLDVFNIDSTHNATVAYQDNEGTPVGAVTGYTAVKVA